MTYYIGDIHGQLATLARLLRDAGLVDERLRWSGGNATLWFMGDFVDRGPDGIGVVDLVMRLEREAAAAGGAVRALLGNHDALLLAAHRFGLAKTTGAAGTFTGDWLRNGGEPRDLELLTPAHIAWISALPAMARQGDTLLAHADAMFYSRYGGTIEDVNAAFHALLQSNDSAAWDRLLDDFSERLIFTGRDGEQAIERLLTMFGGARLVHGHTPINYYTGGEAAGNTHPHVYAEARCIAIDGGLYLGGPGFILEL